MEHYQTKINNNQIDLFFQLVFGNVYESLELHMMAFRYYMRAKQYADKLFVSDPDTALVYCNLGSLMIRLREYEWAFRCFWRSKEIRENILGGDTVDTATVYNNLGVCCFYLQIYYASHGFFQLSYEIYKKLLG